MSPTPRHTALKVLLVEYERADLAAAAHYQFLRSRRYPTCFCQWAASSRFRRLFKP